MTGSSRLDKLLREGRYAGAFRESARLLASLGWNVSNEDLVPLDILDPIWSRYLTRLRAQQHLARRWPASDSAGVKRCLDGLAESLGARRVIWVALVDAEPVGIGVPADVLLRAALTDLVSAQRDLMLTTPDAADGITVEFNHLPLNDEYEIVTWGMFAE